MLYFGRAKNFNGENAEQERRRRALLQAQTLDALMRARGLGVADVESLLANGLQESAQVGKASAYLPGLERARETVTEKAPELAGPTLKIYSGLAAAALKHKCELGFCLWSFARSLDVSGAGRLSRALITSESLKHISKDRLKRALRQAEKAGLMRLVHRRRDGQKMFTLAGLYSAARALDVPSLGAAPVLVPAGKSRNAAVWKATLYGAYHAGRKIDSAPISRRNITQDTGLPERTQRLYEGGSRRGVRERLVKLGKRPAHMRPRAEHKRRASVRSAGAAGVQAHRNFSLEPVPHGDKHALRDTIAEHRLNGRSAFVVRGRFGSNLLVTLPNSYTAPRAQLAKRGMINKVNRSLRVAYSINADGQHTKGPRLFHATGESALRAVKRYGRKLERPPLVCYARLRDCQSGAALWAAK